MSQLTTQEAELQALCQKTASSSSFKELEGLVKLPRNMLDHIPCSWDEQQRPKDFNHCEQLVAGETSDLLVCVCVQTQSHRDQRLSVDEKSCEPRNSGDGFSLIQPPIG